jgi:hypothetical protein
MFKSLNLSYKTGEYFFMIFRLSMKQFSEWIKKHKKLYNNYYDGFHNDIWELDEDIKKPKYLVTES